MTQQDLYNLLLDPSLSLEVTTIDAQRTIGKIVTPELLTCRPETTIAEAARRMREAVCGSILVTNENGEAVGIWTEADVLRLDLLDPHALSHPISSVMSSPVKPLPHNITFSEAAVYFRHHNIRHYLVIDDDNRYRGVLSQTDVVLNQGAEFFLQLKEIGTIPLRPPLRVAHSLPLAEVARQMRQERQDAVIVDYDDGGEPGILTQRDVLRLVIKEQAQTAAGELASRPLQTLRQHTSLYSARKMMSEHRVRHLGVLDDNEQLRGLVGFADILAQIEHEYMQELHSALKERDEALNASRQNQRLAHKVFESTLEGILITNAAGIIESVNPAFSRITGWTQDDVVGKTPKVLSSGRQSDSFYRHMWTSLQENGFWQGEIVNRRKDGRNYHEHLTITGISNEQGVYTHFAGIFTDITQRKLNEERLHYLANHDSLTGLPNRTLFMERLSASITSTRRNQKQMALMFLDLDRFKIINDTLGHQAGDRLLCAVAERLTATLRESDTVARLGGDEFTVIVEDVQDVRHVARVAQKLVDALISPLELENQEIFATTSIGIAIYPSDGEDADVLLMNADTAMYRAKESGKNTFEFFTTDMNAETVSRMQIESGLHRAIERQELSLFYQPKYRLDTEALCGMEVLLRWNNAELGAVPPTRFIPVAEDSNQILAIGEWVLANACQQAQTWLAQGLLPGPIAVNLSGKQIRQPNIVETVRNILETSNLPASWLELEITESVAMDNTHEVGRTLASLKALGVRLAIDDFGTGYSSLAYLKRLPIDVLKIDRAFIQNLHEDPDDAAIVVAITSMAHTLGLEPIAEGIEHEEQFRFLRENGCTYGQGFLFSRPVPVQEMDDLLVESQALRAWGNPDAPHHHHG